MNSTDPYEVMTTNGKRPYCTPGVRFKDGAPVRDKTIGLTIHDLVGPTQPYALPANVVKLRLKKTFTSSDLL